MTRNMILSLFVGVFLFGCATNEVDTDRIDTTYTAVFDRTVAYLDVDGELEENTRKNRIAIVEATRRTLEAERRVKVDASLVSRVRQIREWHDGYVRGDESLADYQREGAMISSEVLVATLEEAAGIDRNAVDRVGK